MKKHKSVIFKRINSSGYTGGTPQSLQALAWWTNIDNRRMNNIDDNIWAKLRALLDRSDIGEQLENIIERTRDEIKSSGN